MKSHRHGLSFLRIGLATLHKDECSIMPLHGCGDATAGSASERSRKPGTSHRDAMIVHVDEVTIHAQHLARDKHAERFCKRLHDPRDFVDGRDAVERAGVSTIRFSSTARVPMSRPALMSPGSCSNQLNCTPTRYSLRHTTRHGSRKRSSGMINVNSSGMRRRSENSSAAPVLDMSRTMHGYLSPP